MKRLFAVVCFCLLAPLAAMADQVSVSGPPDDAGVLMPLSPLMPSAAPSLPSAVSASPVSAAPSAAAIPSMPGAPEDFGAALDTGKQLVAAFKVGNWAAVFSLGLMLLVFVLRMFWRQLPTAAVPWVAAGLGMAIQTAMSLSAGQNLIQALNSGIVMSAAASGFWDLVGKRVFAVMSAAASGFWDLVGKRVFARS